VIKVVNLGAGCKIRDDYKPILRSEGIALQRFRFPGFVQCYASWGSAPPLGQQCAPSAHLLLAALPHSSIPISMQNWLCRSRVCVNSHG